MTTNHPEKLDPALIRPGRINLHVKLGKMSLLNMEKLLKVCYPDSPISPDLLATKIKNYQYTPAEIEQKILICPTFTDFFGFLLRYTPN